MSTIQLRTNINQFYGIGALNETDISKLILGSTLQTMYAKIYEIARALKSHGIPQKDLGIYVVAPDVSLIMTHSIHYNGGKFSIIQYSANNPTGELLYEGELQGLSVKTIKEAYPRIHFSDSEKLAEQMKETIEKRKRIRITLDKTIPLKYTLEVHTLKGIESGYTLARSVLPLPVSNFLGSFVVTGNTSYVADMYKWLDETLSATRRATMYIPYAYATTADARNRVIYATGLAWGHHLLSDHFSYGDIIQQMEHFIGTIGAHGYGELYYLANELGIGNLADGQPMGLLPNNFLSLFAFLFLLYVLYENKQLRVTSMALEQVYNKFEWVFNVLPKTEQFE